MRSDLRDDEQDDEMMSSKLKPTGFKPAFLSECLDVLSAEPPVIRWRFRPREHFPLGEFGERAFKAWGKSFAGQLIRAGSDGRFRLSLSGRTISGGAVIAEIGVTPIGDRQGMPEGMTDDRFADTREIAGNGKLAAIVQAALAETRRPINDLMVMGAADPYRLDTKAKHRDAQMVRGAGRALHRRGQEHPSARRLLRLCVGWRSQVARWDAVHEHGGNRDLCRRSLPVRTLARLRAVRAAGGRQERQAHRAPCCVARAAIGACVGRQS